MRRGFSLIELLIVIAIIAILAAMLFPVYARAREKARQATCTSNQRQLALAAAIYAQEHDETLPPLSTFWSSLALPPQLLTCPSRPDLPNGYIVPRAWDGIALGELPAPDQCVLSADGVTRFPGGLPNTLYTVGDCAFRHDRGLLASFVDGHVRSLTALDGPMLPYPWPETGKGYYLDVSKTGLADGAVLSAADRLFSQLGTGANAWDTEAGDFIDGVYYLVPAAGLLFTQSHPAFNYRSTLTLPAGELHGGGAPGKANTFVLVGRITSPDCCLRSDGDSRGMHFELSHGKPGFTDGDDHRTYTAATGVNFADGSPHVLIESTGSDGRVTLYGDGARLASWPAASTFQAGARHTIGARGDGTGALSGEIAAIALVSGAITAREARDLMFYLRCRYDLHW